MLVESTARSDTAPINRPRTPKVDFLETGAGPAVILVHSSVSGARQWRRLMEDLKGDFHVRAVNLFGYGKTEPWPNETPQTLDDQARLVEAAIPQGADQVSLVGHSFGGAVAMKAAARLGDRVAKLVLFEANPFHLLKQAGRIDAFAEAAALRNIVKTCGAQGAWSKAAEEFADYWNGPGAWAAMSPDRRATFAEAIKPNFFEWDAVMDETPLAVWARTLPKQTLVISDPNTVRPARELTEIFRGACPQWTYREIPAGGHMAPLTHPELVNPIVSSYLRAPPSFVAT
jgi:pimeloyl-ACP methyl ester carboxylesterase